MRLIRKQDQAVTQINRITFAEGADSSPRHPAPAWIQAAATLRKLEGKSTSTDPAEIEKTAYENGFRQGEKAGREIAERKIEAMMRRYSETIQEIGGLKPRLYAQAEHEVVKLALEVARKIVHREVHVDREIIQTLVKVALRHVAVKSPVTIHLHPSDYAYMLEQRAAAGGPGDGEQEMALVSDKTIERGGCLIETECGEIDARIEDEFREVERAFFEGGE